jgi:hypothetical protein
MDTLLLPEILVREDGSGKEIALGTNRGRPLLLTLDVTRMMEQESLDISIWGSTDQRHWRQLATYPQKFHCGTYLLMLDLSRHQEVRYLRAQWRMSRWGGDELAVLAGFHLSAQELKAEKAATA